MTNFFHRSELAATIASRVLTAKAGSASTSGLFLSAPRRTGKSTFIREDLRPALQSMGAIVIYADLWSDRTLDPGKIIVSAVRSELAKRDGVLTRIAKNIGVEKIQFAGVATLEMDRVGLGGDISLSLALSALSDEIRRPIVLIVDEAQHAVSTEHGANTLFALKAARDEVNSSEHFGLHIICTGSSQVKLAMLRNSKEQAFFGAHLYEFPHLGEDYVAWFCEQSLIALDRSEVMSLFEKASFRPEIVAHMGRTTARKDGPKASDNIRQKSLINLRCHSTINFLACGSPVDWTSGSPSLHAEVSRAK